MPHQTASRIKTSRGGFTTVELLVTIAIISILASIAIPSFITVINNAMASSTISQLTGDLYRARSEAVKRNRYVLICTRANDTSCGAGTNWSQGWLVCYDENQDAACDAAPADGSNPNPIVVHQAINSHLLLTGSAAAITYNPDGTQGTGGAATLTLTGNWTGAVTQIATIAATGNLSKTP